MGYSSQSSIENSVSSKSSQIERGATDIPLSLGDDATLSDDESKYITGRKLYLINAGLIVSIFIAQMESSIISTAVVAITDQLGGYEKSSWLFTAYLLTYCGEYLHLQRLYVC
jgi:hypothetical protein